MAKEQTSAGLIPYRRTDTPEILLLLYPHGHWSFPKGHVEDDENLWDTAVRELKEETSLDIQSKDENFQDNFEYLFEQDGETIHKTVYYFSAQVSVDGNVSLSHEHEDYEWLKPDRVPNRITFENARDTFNKWREEIL